MWIAEQWQDYELLDCGGGEKLERWGDGYNLQWQVYRKRIYSFMVNHIHPAG